MIETLRDTLDAARLCLDSIRLCLAAVVVGDVLSFGVLIALLAASRGRGAGCPKPERPRKPQKAMRPRDRVRILGTSYMIRVKSYVDDKQFETRNICGYCDSQAREIVVCDPATYANSCPKSPAVVAADIAETKRHEIIHAFLDESGLGAASLPYDGAWARNEEMVDWLAIQGPKIYQAWKEAGAI